MASAAAASAAAAPGAFLPPPGQLTSVAQFQRQQRTTPSLSRTSASDQVYCLMQALPSDNWNYDNTTLLAEAGTGNLEIS